MTYHKSSRTAGFTLVELSLSMVFISVLLLSIAMLVMQITSIYSKSFTIREVNEAGKFISNELQRTLNQNGSDKVVYTSFPDDQGARLCAGQIVYAWNYRDTIAPGFTGTAINQRRISSSNPGLTRDVRFMKYYGSVKDCELKDDGTYKSIPDTAVEQLSSGNGNIALSELEMSSAVNPDDDLNQSIYQIRLTVGTTDVTLINGNNCSGTDRKGDEYCAINEFVFTARSGNREDRGGAE